MDGGSDNRTGHHGFRFAEPQVRETPPVVTIQLGGGGGGGGGGGRECTVSYRIFENKGKPAPPSWKQCPLPMFWQLKYTFGKSLGVFEQIRDLARTQQKCGGGLAHQSILTFLAFHCNHISPKKGGWGGETTL